jgi:hypothetical protein
LNNKRILLPALIAVFFISCVSPIFQVSNSGVASAQSNLQILSDIGFIDSGDECYHVCGEVLNTGTQTLSNTEIAADFYDAGGQKIANYNHRISLNNQSPNTKSPFTIIMSDKDQSKQVASYVLMIYEGSPTDALPRALTVSGIFGFSYTKYNNKYVTGQVWNEAISDAHGVRIIATFYDSSEKVVYTQFDTKDVVGPNGIVEFSVGSRLNPAAWTRATHCSVTAESMEYSGNLVTDITFQEQIPEMPPIFVMLLLVVLLVGTLFAKKRTDKKKDRL